MTRTAVQALASHDIFDLDRGDAASTKGASRRPRRLHDAPGTMLARCMLARMKQRVRSCVHAD